MSTDRLNCGCYAIRLCPLHARAEAMLSLLQDLIGHVRDLDDIETQARATVRAIEGKQTP